MHHLLDLPPEILFLIFEHLSIRDLKQVDETCTQLKEVVQYGNYEWLEKFYSYGKPNDPDSVERTLRGSNPLVLAHFLRSRLTHIARYNSFGARHLRALDPLLAHGASLTHIREPSEVKELFCSAMQSAGIDYLFQHGAQINAYSGGINALLEYYLRRNGQLSDLAQCLIQRGASVCDVPCGTSQLADCIAYRWGETPLLKTLLENGAVLGSEEGGVGKLFQEAMRLGGPQGKGSLYLLHNGATFEDLPGGINQLLAQTFRERGPDPVVDFLISQGGSLDNIGERGAYHEFLSLLLDDGSDSDEDSDVRLESAVYLLENSNLADTRGGIPGVLEELYRNYGPSGPIDEILATETAEDGGWSLEDAPIGIDGLLAETQELHGIDGILYLLNNGAPLEALSETPEDLLIRLFTEKGTELAFSTLRSLGANTLAPNNEDVDASCIGDYLLKYYGTSLAELPGGAPQLLQDVFLGHGRQALPWIQFTFDISFFNIPCGFPQALVKSIEVNALAENVCTDHIKVMLEGTSDQVDPGQLAPLIEAFFRRYGYSPVLDQLLEFGGWIDIIHKMLEDEHLVAQRRYLSETLANADFLVKHGAKVEQMPSGATKVLEQVLDKFEHGPRTKWLLDHGAPQAVFDRWKSARGKGTS